MKCIRCSECGVLLMQNTATCNNCGNPLSGIEETVSGQLCPECNSIVEKDADDCPFCGCSLDNSLEARAKELEEVARIAEERAKESEHAALVSKRIMQNKKKREEYLLRIENAQKRIEATKQNPDQLTGISDTSSSNNVSNINQADQTKANIGRYIRKPDFGVSRQRKDLHSFAVSHPGLKKRILTILAVALTSLIVILLIINWPKQIKSFSIPYYSYEVIIGEPRTIDLDIEPRDANTKPLTWESSDTALLSIENHGLLIGKSEGDCILTVTSKNGESDTTIIHVKAPEEKKTEKKTEKKQTETKGNKLSQLYVKLNKPTYCTIASDDSYLLIDTNPNNFDGIDDPTGTSLISQANDYLGLPESLLSKMSHTRAIDGRQSETYSSITVSWTYHPNQGLEVMYELNR